MSAGMPEKKDSKAANPPVEAPMPTMGNGFPEQEGSTGLADEEGTFGF
jgi:hypothetical protein